MIIIECEQGDEVWREHRMGIPTASEMHRVITPSQEKIAAGRWSYAAELVVERLLDESREPIDGLPHVERGKALEPKAVEHYEGVYGKTAKCGLILSDNRKFGCSPDRLLCDELGGLEIKSPAAHTHVMYWANGPGNDYRCQVQGSLLLTRFDFWDWMSWHPQLPERLIRFRPDEPFIKKMQVALDQFNDEVDELCEKIRSAGVVSPISAVSARPDSEWQKMLAADENLWALA